MPDLPKKELPPDFELITDGEVYRWRIISSHIIGVRDYLYKEDTIEAAWRHYYYLQSEQKRAWRKVI